MKNKILLFAIAFLPLYSMAQDTLQQPLSFVQEMPTYPGGETAMMQVIFENVVYPEYEKSMNIEGTVFVNFVIEKDGTPTNFKITRGVEGGIGLDREALHACMKLGKFNPGTQNGVPQRVYLTIPIKFSLGEDSDAEERLSKSDLKQIKKDGEFICDIMYKLIEAKRAGDQVEIEKLIAELDVKLKALHKSYSDESTRVKELDKIVEPCMEEAAKAVMGE